MPASQLWFCRVPFCLNEGLLCWHNAKHGCQVPTRCSECSPRLWMDVEQCLKYCKRLCENEPRHNCRRGRDMPWWKMHFQSDCIAFQFNSILEVKFDGTAPAKDGVQVQVRADMFVCTERWILYRCVRMCVCAWTGEEALIHYFSIFCPIPFVRTVSSVVLMFTQAHTNARNVYLFSVGTVR